MRKFLRSLVAITGIFDLEPAPARIQHPARAERALLNLMR